MTRRQASQLVAVLKAAHPLKRISAETVRLYESRLVELHYETAREAVGDLIDGSSYWPTVAEVKKACREVAARRRTEEKPEELPDPSPEERERMLAEMRRYMAGIGRPMETA